MVEKSVSTERRGTLFYGELSRQVSEAFNQPRMVTYTTVGGMTVTSEDVERCKKMWEAISQKGEEELIENIVEHNDTSSVFVEDPQDYPELLRMAYQQLNWRTNAGIDVDRVVEEIRMHEVEHSIPFVDEGIKVRYGIQVTKDPLRNKLGVNAAISWEGVATIGTYKSMISNPEELSGTDKILNGEFEL